MVRQLLVSKLFTVASKLLFATFQSTGTGTLSVCICFYQNTSLCSSFNSISTDTIFGLCQQVLSSLQSTFFAGRYILTQTRLQNNNKIHYFFSTEIQIRSHISKHCTAFALSFRTANFILTFLHSITDKITNCGCMSRTVYQSNTPASENNKNEK